MIIIGYVGGPPAVGQAVTFDFDGQSITFANGSFYTIGGFPDLNSRIVQLTVRYWPVPCDGIGSREFYGSGMPFVCEANSTPSLADCEALALRALGIAYTRSGLIPQTSL